jgi:hypothetical protein
MTCQAALCCRGDLIKTGGPENAWVCAGTLRGNVARARSDMGTANHRPRSTCLVLSKAGSASFIWVP